MIPRRAGAALFPRLRLPMPGARPLHRLRWMRVRDGRFFFVFEADLFPRARLGEQCPQQLVIQLMTRFVSVERPDKAVSQKIQITNRIEDLVLYKLVLVAQTVFVQY